VRLFSSILFSLNISPSPRADTGIGIFHAEPGRGMNLWERACRYCLQLLTPASILASLQGRGLIELEDVGEMNDLFLDAKTSAEAIAAAA
jgi:hypothetical protein